MWHSRTALEKSISNLMSFIIHCNPYCCSFLEMCIHTFVTGTADCKSLATCKLNSGKPQLIYHSHMNLIIFPASACPTSLFKHNCGFPLFSLHVCKTFAICCTCWKDNHGSRLGGLLLQVGSQHPQFLQEGCDYSHVIHVLHLFFPMVSCLLPRNWSHELNGH